MRWRFTLFLISYREQKLIPDRGDEGGQANANQTQRALHQAIPSEEKLRQPFSVRRQAFIGQIGPSQIAGAAQEENPIPPLLQAHL